MRANVVGSVDVLPAPMIGLAPGVRAGSGVARVIVRKEPTETGALAVTGLSGTAPWIKVSQRSVTAPEPAAEGLPAALPGDVVLTIDAAAAPVGSVLESVTFATGLTREPSVSIPVRVTVRGPIVLQPRDIILNREASDPELATGMAIAAVREDLDPKQLVVASDSPAFSVKTDPNGERGYRLTVSWKRVTGNEPTEGNITLSIGKESIKLPVRVNVGQMPARAGKP